MEGNKEEAGERRVRVGGRDWRAREGEINQEHLQPTPNVSKRLVAPWRPALRPQRSLPPSLRCNSFLKADAPLD